MDEEKNEEFCNESVLQFLLLINTRKEIDRVLSNSFKMYYFMKNIIYLLFIALFFSACRDDETLIDDPILVSMEEPIVLEGYEPPYEAVTATVFGQIFNENGDPIEGVAISAENDKTTTDKNGLFTFSEITMNAEGTLVKANLQGYVTGSRTVYPEEGSTSRIKITLIPKQLSGTFESKLGGTIQVDGGASILFQPDGIVYAGGGAYEGSVNVFAKLLDPTRNETISEMPGDLTGIQPTESYSETGLMSFGMLSVELYSDDDRKLQLAADAPAEITIPVPESMNGDAPQIIPLWYYNEDVAKWVEEGEAILENGKYKGEVTHFSFWNVDIKVESTFICLTFENSDGNPIAGMEVFIKSQSSGIGSGVTDGDGFVSGIVPANTPLSICTGAIVNDATWSHDIGPISTKTDLTFQLNLTEIVGIDPKFIVIPGHLTCNGNDIEHSMLRVESNTDVTFYEITEQPFTIFHYLNDGEEVEKMQMTNLENKIATQEMLTHDASILWFNDYDMCLDCLLYTSPSPRDATLSRMPSSA